ncbi:MAG: glycosyltransferase family 2 protein [Anaerolineae bacterium]
MFDLSIIIVTYNPGTILYDCLHSLINGVSDLSTEVIVIDNASDDGVVPLAAERFPHVKFIFNKDNKGFAGGNNQGLAIASGRYLLLLNPDVIVKPASLKILVDFLRANLSVGIVGPRTFDGNGELSLTANTLYTPLTILWQYLGFDRVFSYHVYGWYRHKSLEAIEPFEVAWVQGCCLMMRREVYEQISGLDEVFFLFAEEPDFCDRASKAGWKSYFLPSAEIIHHESNSVSRYPERKIRNYHISPLHYFRKRGRRRQVWVLKAGFAAELLLKICWQLLRRNKSGRLFIYRNVLWEVLQY